MMASTLARRVLTLINATIATMVFAAYTLLHTASRLPRLPHFSVSSTSTAAAVSTELLKLNTKSPVDCPKVLVLRTPKTASSSLTALFFLRRIVVGRNCTHAFFPAGRHLPMGQYTLTAEILRRRNLSTNSLRPHTAFIAHMNYTPELRSKIDVQRLYRVATLRTALPRAESLFAYEADRPHIRLRPALEYLGAPRLPPAVANNDEMPESLTWGAVSAQVRLAVHHWNLIVLAEEWHKSLAVLMHDLKWRVVDVLGPQLNVHLPDARAKALERARQIRLRNDTARNHLDWVVRVDDALYESAKIRLVQRFDGLPSLYKQVPQALRILTPQLEAACGTHPAQKHLTLSDIACIREFRRNLLRRLDVPVIAR